MLAAITDTLMQFSRKDQATPAALALQGLQELCRTEVCLCIANKRSTLAIRSEDEMFYWFWLCKPDPPLLPKEAFQGSMGFYIKKIKKNVFLNIYFNKYVLLKHIYYIIISGVKISTLMQEIHFFRLTRFFFLMQLKQGRG